LVSDNEPAAAEPVEVTVKPTKGKKKVKVAVATNGDATEPTVTVAVVEEPKVQDKPKKQGKKAKAVVDTNGDAPELAVAVTVAAIPKTQEKPKKQGKKAKAAVVEEAVVAEAPAEKAKPAKKSKKAEVAPVEEEVTVEAPVKKSKKVKSAKKQEEPVEEVSEVITADEVDGEVEEDDQTAALLAGFESDDDEAKDPENDADFDEDATVPALTKKQRTALEKATQGPRSNVPGVIYIGCV
jgi:nucleolar protein 15